MVQLADFIFEQLYDEDFERCYVLPLYEYQQYHVLPVVQGGLKERAVPCITISVYNEDYERCDVLSVVEGGLRV